MEELDYHPNAVARSLRTRKTQVIGVVVSDITNPFFATLVRGAEDAALEAGYSIVVCNSDETLEKENRYVQVLRRRRVDGMLLAPVVEADTVLSDNVGGAYLATKHLIERGHERIGIVLGIPGATTTEERYLGYRKALEEAGISVSEELVAYGGYRVEGGREATAKLLALDPPPTAIFSTNNLMTVGVLQELFARGVRIPDQVAVVGFDDLEWAEMITPALTVVAQNPYEIGQKALLTLLKRMNEGLSKEPLTIRVPVELRARKSVSTSKSGRKERA